MAESAIEILKNRLAAGEISLDQYKQILNELNCTSDISPGNTGSSVSSSNEASTMSRLAKRAYDAVLGDENYKDPVDNNPLKVTNDFTVYGSFFVYKGSKFPIADIKSIGFQGESSSAAGIVPIGSSSLLRLIMDDGLKIDVLGSSIPLMGGKNKDVRAAFQILSSRTLSSRFDWYMNSLRQKGYIESGGVKITGDGYVIKGEKNVNLRIAAQSNNIIFGSHWGTNIQGGSNPYEVVVGESGTGVFSSKVKFQVIYDRDIVFHIIRQLAGIKS